MRIRGLTHVALTTLGAVVAAGGCADLEGATFAGDSDSDGSSGGADDPTTSVSAGFDDGGDADADDDSGDGDAGPACVMNADCDEGAPLCVAGDCLGCDAVADPTAACIGLDPNAPVCTDGRCRQCDEQNTDACVEGTPVCGEDNVCAPCSTHGQCATACALDSGHCIETVLIVDGEGGSGFTEIGLALETVPPGERAAIFVKAAPDCYLENIEVLGERSIALLGLDDVRPCLTSLTDEPAITVAAGSALYLQDFSIEGAWGTGIDGRGAKVFIDRSTLVNNQGGAVHVSQASRLHTTNSILGGDRNNVPAVDVDASDVVIEYSTIAGGFGSAMALRCKGEGTHSIRNSILVAESGGGEVDCADATIVNSALESAFGMGNRAVGPVDTAAWFVDFAGGDLHLDAEVPEVLFGDVARWKTGDPTTDLDGDPRPTMDGATDWCGADVP